MEIRPNIRGTIDALSVGQFARFIKREVRQSYVRNAASALKADKGKVFKVNSEERFILVTRLA